LGESVKRNDTIQLKTSFLNELAIENSGRAGSSFCPGSALRAEIAVKSVDRGVQNQVAVGTSFEMAFDLDFDGLGEPPL
jgi:hypothetical protein